VGTLTVLVIRDAVITLITVTPKPVESAVLHVVQCYQASEIELDRYVGRCWIHVYGTEK
jgi:hypothetical protein